MYVYLTTDWFFIAMGAATLLAGFLVFLVWSSRLPPGAVAESDRDLS